MTRIESRGSIKALARKTGAKKLVTILKLAGLPYHSDEGLLNNILDGYIAKSINTDGLCSDFGVTKALKNKDISYQFNQLALLCSSLEDSKLQILGDEYGG